MITLALKYQCAQVTTRQCESARPLRTFVLRPLLESFDHALCHLESGSMSSRSIVNVLLDRCVDDEVEDVSSGFNPSSYIFLRIGSDNISYLKQKWMFNRETKSTYDNNKKIIRFADQDKHSLCIQKRRRTAVAHVSIRMPQKRKFSIRFLDF